jgi:hypothetical protein
MRTSGYLIIWQHWVHKTKDEDKQAKENTTQKANKISNTNLIITGVEARDTKAPKG